MNNLANQIAELQSRVVQAYSQNPDGKLALKHAVEMLEIMGRIVNHIPHNGRTHT